MTGKFVVTEFGTVGEIIVETKTRWQYRGNTVATCPRKSSYGPFDTRDAAENFSHRLKSAAGERDRRLRSAHEWFNNQVAGLAKGAGL